MWRSTLIRSTLINVASAAMLTALVACGHLTVAQKPATHQSTSREQLSVGYSLLYQEADGIPKLKWILMFKEKPGNMGQLTDELISYYQRLAETMRRLSKDYPGMRIDLSPISAIESEERKSIGEDLAKDFAPLVGKTGIDFEREALLMFYNSLNEQRHLTRVMAVAETDPGLRRFLETTEAQLDERYAKVGSLLAQRYFTH